MPDTVDHDKAIEASNAAQQALKQTAEIREEMNAGFEARRKAEAGLRKEMQEGFQADQRAKEEILGAVNELKSDQAALSATAGNVSIKWILGACFSMVAVLIAGGTLGLSLVAGIGSLASKPMQNAIINNSRAIEEAAHSISKHESAIVQHKSAIDYNSQAISSLQAKAAELNAAALNGKRQATAIALVHQRIRQLELQGSIEPPGEDDIYHPNGH